MGRSQHTELNERCPIRDILDKLGDRWTVLVLTELEQGTLRFSELRKLIIDISPRMLAQTLRQLEQDGLVSRKVYPTIPPKVEYTMTTLGVSFYDNVKRMVIWAEENQAAVKAARQAYTPQEAYPAL
ncbi:helix-turn-helix domain-containing protein [Chromatiaceae bacterium AAb-1]|nr:helix-turn-helix domain-containing protein [Chromatiaceae bacterium AAb-1]